MLEPDVAAPGQQLGPDALHHLAEHVGADVGLVGPEDVLRRAVLHQGLQHGGDAAVVGARGQLAVGKGACATLPELDVGERVQHPGGPEGGYIGGALFHRAAPLQYDGGQPRPGQEQGGEQARRAHAHHHWRQGGGPGGGGKDIGLPLKQGDVFAVGTAHQVLLVVGRQLHGADVVDVGFFPGVDGLADQGQVPDQGRAESQQPGSLASELLQVPVHGEGKIADSYHVIT